MDLTYAYAGEVVKHERDAGGALIVYGKATGPDIDLDGQRCDPEWLRTAMPAWFRSGGNVREQHDSKRAVGTAIEHEVTKGDDHMVRARIVDPVAIAKVEAGVLRGFSIGVKNAQISKSVASPNGDITGGAVCELSLVDRPCLPTATFTMCKAAKPGMTLKGDDFDAERMLVRVEELLVKADDAADEAPAEVTTVDQAQAVADAALEAVKDAEDIEVTITDEAADAADEVEAPEVEKAIDVDNLSAPAPGLKCETCGEDGHLFCAPANVDFPADDVAAIDRALKAAAGVVEKADGPYTVESDIVGARRAIAILGALSASESAELADMPEQAWDIRLLLQAASSLHAFICNERDEELGEAIAGVTTVSLSADPDAEKADQADDVPVEGEVVKADEPSDDAPAAEDVAALVKAAVDEAMKAAVAELTKTLEEARAVEKAAEADLEKAAGAAPMTPEIVLKTVATATGEDDSEIRKIFTAIAEESTAKAAGALSARLDVMERMATPNGPVLRRTEQERDAARRNDLEAEVDRLESLAKAANHDPDLRKGYALTAARLKAELKTLQ
jgi:hypothetical protein